MNFNDFRSEGVGTSSLIVRVVKFSQLRFWQKELEAGGESRIFFVQSCTPQPHPENYKIKVDASIL
jgi:hypothetical protein